MKNKVLAVAVFLFFAVGFKAMYCSNNVYTYYCAIDRIIQQFTLPGIYNCPKCNAAMMPK
jgi:hypothetical protein